MSMSNYKQFLIDLIHDEEGASALEYALLAAMVAVAIAFFVTPIKTAIQGTFTTICTAIGGTGCTPP